MPITPIQYIDILCQLVSDEPTTSGVTLAQAERSFADSVFSRDEDVRLQFEVYGMENIFTPRRQLRQVLTNTAMHVDGTWNGQEAIHDACRLFEKSIIPEELGTERFIASHVFTLAAKAYAMSILPEIAICRPHDRPASVTPNGKFPAWYLQVYGVRKGNEETASMIQMRLARTFISVIQNKLHAAFSSEEITDRLGLDVWAELISGISREAALELNQAALQKLLDAAPSPEEDCLGRLALRAQTRYQFENAANALFARCGGIYTHLIAGPDAWVSLRMAGLIIPVAVGRTSNPEKLVGLTEFAVQLEGVPATTKVWMTPFWAKTNPSALLFVRNIPHDLAGALAYAPYRWGATNISESPNRFQITYEAAMEVVEPSHVVKVELR